MSKDFFRAATFGDMVALRRMIADDPTLVHARLQWGFTALHDVAGEEQYEAAEFLIDQGADPNAKNDEHITPLHLAAYPEMADLLIRRGANIEARALNGDTPLIVAASEAERGDVMEELLRLGADVHARNKWGKSAMDIARAREEDEKIEILQQYGAA